MIEPTIVFTHYALMLTAGTFLLTGSLIGWAVTTYVRTREINILQGKLKEIQIQLTAASAVKSDSGSQEKEKEKATAPALRSLHKKKDRLLKDFMRRQLQQKKALDTINKTLKQERSSRLELEERLNTAQQSLDQWKEKCSVLAAANSKMRNSISQAGNDSLVSKPVATASKPKVRVTSRTRTTIGGKPVIVADVTANKIQVPVAVKETAVTKVANPNSSQTRKISGATSKLTSINGIGPAIEKELKKLGVSSIQQMAELNKADIQRLDKQLGKYSGRIERQEWVKQARQLDRKSATQSEAA